MVPFFDTACPAIPGKVCIREAARIQLFSERTVLSADPARSHSICSPVRV